MADRKVTIHDLKQKASAGEKICMLTAYDYPTAMLLQRAGVDAVLVGDSAAMVVHGMDSTLNIGMELMLAHIAAVRRGAPNLYLIGDMPYMSYQPSIERAVENAGRFMQAGADAVKLEGGRNVIDTTRSLVNATIPVVGHIGLTPQSAAQLGGMKVQARQAAQAIELLRDAMLLQEAGICMLIVECVPPAVTAEITRRATVPVIGIGSGPHCHGSVLVLHDVLGLFERGKPRFVKQYTNLAEQIESAVKRYAEDVRKGAYPAAEHGYSMPEDQLRQFLQLLDKQKDL